MKEQEEKTVSLNNKHSGAKYTKKRNITFEFEKSLAKGTFEAINQQQTAAEESTQ
jgi:hypothetical protein